MEDPLPPTRAMDGKRTSRPLTRPPRYARVYVAQSRRQLRPWWVCLFVIIRISFAVEGRAAIADSAKPTPIVVLKGGDDGLTNRLSDAIEKAFEASPDFKLSNGKQRGTLIVLIPTNVDWKPLRSTQSDGRTPAITVLYAVEFRSVDDRVIASRAGSCRDDRMEECAAEVIKGAKAAVRRIR